MEDSFFDSSSIPFLTLKFYTCFRLMHCAFLLIDHKETLFIWGF